MWIKNLAVFMADEPFSWSAGELDEILSENRCPPCGQQTMSTEGFVPPLKDQEQMVYAVDGFLFCVHQETTRLLPGPVIKEQLDERVEHIEREENRKVGRKEKAEIKEQITFELMPKAFTRSRRTQVLIDMERGRVLVDCASATRAEQVVSALRKALGSLPVAYPSAKAAPSMAFSQWLRDPALLPEGYTLGDRCELKGTKDEGATVRFTSVDLRQEEILAHLDKDMLATRLNLCWQDALEFDLADSLEIKRIRPLDTVRENIDALEADDAVAELMARIALQGEVLREGLDVVYDHFEVQA